MLRVICSLQVWTSVRIYNTIYIVFTLDRATIDGNVLHHNIKFLQIVLYLRIFFFQCYLSIHIIDNFLMREIYPT